MGSKGDRESQWRVLNRCLNILLHLMRGRATTDELRAILYDDAASAEQNTDGNNLQKRFVKDKERLRDWFLAEIHFDKSAQEYELTHIGRPLVDLPEDAIRGLAFLEQTFSDDSVPMALDVRAFISTVAMLLPHERLKQVEKQRGLLEMELGAQDTENIQSGVMEAVKICVSERRQLKFDYLAPRNEDNIPRTKITEPLRYFFDTVRKHYYLEAFALSSYAPHKGLHDQKREVRKYRLDRMSDPKPLPAHFPANQRIPTKKLEYELTPIAARLGVTHHFPDMQVFYNDDGSARVIVPSRDLFFDLRTLLHYGANCRVIGGNDALYEMKRIIKAMALVYEDDTDE